MSRITAARPSGIVGDDILREGAQEFFGLFHAKIGILRRDLLAQALQQMRQGLLNHARMSNFLAKSCATATVSGS